MVSLDNFRLRPPHFTKRRHRISARGRTNFWLRRQRVLPQFSES